MSSGGHATRCPAVAARPFVADDRQALGARCNERYKPSRDPLLTLEAAQPRHAMARFARTVDSIDEGPPDPQWPRAEFIAAAVAILCYINALPNDFCDDGRPIVRDSALINEPGMWGAIWTTDYWSDTKDAAPVRDLLYRPVALSSYRLVRELAGLSPFPQLDWPSATPQLLVNVLLHALVSALVARMCRRTKGSEAAAMVAGILFAVLPVHTEVIDNVVGRSDLLVALGILLALIWHRRSMNATTDLGVAAWRLGAAAAAFVAMGAKENGVAVLPLVVLFDAYWYKPWRAASRDRLWWSPRAMVRFAYLLAPTAIYLTLRYVALAGALFQKPALSKTVNVLIDAPPWQSALGVLQLWAMYWEKTFWPKVLNVNYSVNAIRLATSALDAYVIAGGLILIVLAAASVYSWRRGARSTAFLCAAIVLSYLPTANLFALIQVYFAERIWYVPSIWLAVLVGLAFAPFVERPLWAITVAVPMFAMTERCWIRNAEWQHNDTLYSAAYRDHPNAIGALRLHGQSLVNQQQYAQGIELLHRAIEIDGGFTDAQRSLGHAYLKAGDYASALHHLQIADMQVPGHPPTAEALDLVRRLLTAQHEPELIALVEEADRKPGELQTQLALVRRLRELGHLEAARDRLRAGDHRFAREIAWQAEYAVTLVYLNERDAAIDRYRRCLVLDRDNVQLGIELAMLLLERRADKDLDEAWRLARRAAELAPGAPQVLVCRAELLALRGDLKAAAGLYRQAIDTLPHESEYRRRLEARATALGL